MSVTRYGRPTVIGDWDEWTLTGTSKVTAVDALDPLTHDDDTSYLSVLTASTIKQQGFYVSTVKPMSAIVSVSVGCRFKISFAVGEVLNFYAKLNGTAGALVGINAIASGVYQTSTAALPRPGGGAWSVEDVKNPTLQLFIQNPSGNDGAIRVTSLWLHTVCEAVPVQLGQARDVGSRRLLAFRRETASLTPQVLAQLLDAELLDEVGVSHFALPLQDQLGAGLAAWQYVPHRLMRSDFNLDAMFVQPELKDVRNQLVQFWDVGRSKRTNGVSLDGIARVDPGCTRLWTRASRAWVPNPVDGLVHEVQDSEEKVDDVGMLFERAATNGLTRSSFISQLTGWTVTVAGGSSVTADASEPSIFEPGTTGYSAALNTGAAGTAATATSPNTSSYPAATKISVSVDYREAAAGVNLKVRIRRNVDGRFWNGAAWQVGSFDLTVTASTVNARAKWENIDVGAGATTITVQAALLAGGTNRIAFVKHVQVEDSPWATSRIVTDASTLTRAIDQLRVSNTTAARAWNRDRGTLLFRYRPAWTTAAPASSIFYLFDLTYDATNWFRVYYTTAGGSAATLTFEISRAGAVAAATIAATLATGVDYRLAARWTSSLGELGLVYKLSVYVDGVKGTDGDVSAFGLPIEADGELLIGIDVDVKYAADGNLFDIVHTQQVLTDAEISRGF